MKWAGITSNVVIRVLCGVEAGSSAEAPMPDS